MNANLDQIANQMSELLELFSDGGGIFGRILPTQHAARFKRLAIQAKLELDDTLGSGNDFSNNLIHTINERSGGLTGGPSFAAISDAVEILRGASEYIDRKRKRAPLGAPSNGSYVDESVLAHLDKAISGAWDFSRLTALCRELNIAADSNCHMATAMLVRAVCDHVPPIFGCKSFTEVASNYSGSRSFKDHMANLEKSLRKVADGYLHTQIRSRETIPTFVQVDFRSAVGELLGEVIRIAKI